MASRRERANITKATEDYEWLEVADIAQHSERLENPCVELGGIKGESVAERVDLLTTHLERERGAVVAMLLRERAVFEAGQQPMDHFVAIKPQPDPSGVPLTQA
ncbi:unnamed protein product [Vitrella brassicaformis CCMP3155]|uniref:Uncharacterized protein n=1 Tax=Vitrella brassicaformis (strain CCMP3155) TaxID=1169540 RepID=A0A0G4EB88_VITBC|nr:unnamed protein product [Vitrella brassicaformis CCMP3155]|eukprot:CEL92520.1 unnamed protein product [Vitrella brassicaformis CCMP3155]